MHIDVKHDNMFYKEIREIIGKLGLGCEIDKETGRNQHYYVGSFARWEIDAWKVSEMTKMQSAPYRDSLPGVRIARKVQ